jgi:hypothetical protein
MSGATEIYICRPGQALKQGKLEYSSHISTRDEAAGDARRRCAADAGIARIAYYAVDEGGGFRNFFTYENPTAGKPKPERRLGAPAPVQGANRRPARSPPSLLGRIRAVFEEG